MDVILPCDRMRPAGEAGSDPETIPHMNVAAIVLAGGSGTRLGADRNKVYLPLAGCSIIGRSLRAMAPLGRLILVIRPADREQAEKLLAAELPDTPVELVDGGAQRQDSEWHALRHLAPDIADLDVILIHDGARPLASTRLARDVVDAAARFGGAIPGVPAEDLIAVDGADHAVRLTGQHIRVQTPQAFAAGPLYEAYEMAAGDGYSATDTAGCVQRYTDLDVHWVPGSPDNLKITKPGDLTLAEAILAQRR
jgi:2-C-methyl-D-erythritol 4-phosphate cytidylyltransferase